METKKHPNQTISKYRTIYLLTGLITSLGIVLAAFEYRTPQNSPEVIHLEETGFILPDIPISVHEEIQPPKPKQFDVVEVEDEPNVEVDLDDFIFEFDETQSLDEPIFEPIDDEPDGESEFIVLEKEASFKGGQEAWYKFLRKNLKYPKRAQRAGIEGKVFLRFYVDAQGDISNIQVTRSIGGGCDEEAIRVLKMSPKWNPGEQRGRPVKAPMSIYVVFKLN